MEIFRARQFRRCVGALAVFGALLNAWVLTLHITSVALKHLHAMNGGTVICHEGRTKYVQISEAAHNKHSPTKECPICSGMASLPIVIVSEPQLHVAPIAVRGVEIAQIHVALVADHRPLKILNRGPPPSV